MSAPTLGSFGARVVRVHTGDGVEETEGRGGGLEAAVDARGTAPFAALLGANPAWLALELEDADVVLRVERSGGGATLSVKWSGGESYSEALVLPTAGALGFVPDLASKRDVVTLLNDVTSSIFVVEGTDGLEFYGQGEMGSGGAAQPLVASIGPSGPLGPAWFRERLGVKANYIAGAMAGGISSPELVIAMGNAGYIGFLGAGGLPMPAVQEAVPRIRGALGEDHAHGFNLLHNPVEPHVEEATVDLFLEHGCRVVSASAYMGLTAAVVRFRFCGAIRDESGAPHCPNTVLAKVSRPEVAEHFLRPPPAKLLDTLVQSGGLTASEAGIAKELPVAEGITCEADSGGHTDHRPLPVILPVIRAQRDRIATELGYGERGIRVAVGAGGGLGAPEAVYAAFAMGADYVLTGSVNQCTPEAGTSELAKTMLLSAGMADVGSGAAPDMFEIGAHVQVLSRGTMYAQRSNRLFQVYKMYSDWESVPEKDRKKIEKQVLARPFQEVWDECAAYWGERDPNQVERALSDGRHQMALVFRWYLGMSSRWARMGEKSRKKDFQIWCGPSMGAFNDWVAGTSLEPLKARSVVGVADALLKGAAVCERAARLRASGVELPESAGHWRPD